LISSIPGKYLENEQKYGYRKVESLMSRYETIDNSVVTTIASSIGRISSHYLDEILRRFVI
jgi:hypothetical protein